jgi:thioredoxin reductase (NADPH)
MHRRDSFRASKIMQERVLITKNRDYWNTGNQRNSRHKEEGVTGVKIFNTQTNEESLFPTQGVFVAIGHKPNTDLFKDGWKWTKPATLKTEGRTMKTNIEGFSPAATRRIHIIVKQYGSRNRLYGGD